MEAMSVEDDELVFCVYCYNVQPGIQIDYSNGESSGPDFEGHPDPEYDSIKMYSKETITSVQKALNEAGYSSGTPDGLMGPKTNSAISEYRKDHGLNGTNIDAKLLKSLGINADTLR